MYHLLSIYLLLTYHRLVTSKLVVLALPLHNLSEAMTFLVAGQKLRPQSVEQRLRPSSTVMHKRLSRESGNTKSSLD